MLEDASEMCENNKPKGYIKNPLSDLAERCV
jgi:hypothetical protein